jgi:hypothetical protein
MRRMREYTMTTTFSNKALILADLWLNFRDDEQFEDFIEYNDLGLPLSYAIANNIVEASAVATRFVEETFDLLLAGLGIEDTGFELLDDVLEGGIPSEE